MCDSVGFDWLRFAPRAESGYFVDDPLGERVVFTVVVLGTRRAPQKTTDETRVVAVGRVCATNRGACAAGLGHARVKPWHRVPCLTSAWCAGDSGTDAG